MDKDEDNKIDSKLQAGHEESSRNSHWTLIGKLITFQFKLAMDGLRDLLLSPISIGFALYGIVVQRDQPDKYFNRLLRFGRTSDEFINLFGEYDELKVNENLDTATHSKNNSQLPTTVNRRSITSDDYVKKLEEMILTEYKKGGFISEIKEGTDGLLEKLQSKADKSKKEKHD